MVSGGGCGGGCRVGILRRHVGERIAAELAGAARMLLLHLLVRIAGHAIRSARSAAHVRRRADPGAGQVMGLLQLQEGVLGGDGGGGCGSRCRRCRLLVAVSASDHGIGRRRRHVVIAATKVAVDETVGRTGRRRRRRRTPPYLVRRRRLQDGGLCGCVQQRTQFSQLFNCQQKCCFFSFFLGGDFPAAADSLSSHRSFLICKFSAPHTVFRMD